MTITLPPEGPEHVLDAALRAWQVHGETCHVEQADEWPPGLFAALAAVTSRHLEFVVDNEVDAQGWETLSQWPRPPAWQLRALVPQSLLGAAHEHLREDGFELQGWWFDEGRIAFGAVEIA